MVVCREKTGRDLPVSGSMYVFTAAVQRGWLSLLGGSGTVYSWTKEG